MSLHTQFIRRCRQHARNANGQDVGSLLLTDGHANAPVVIAGLQHGEGEEKPFSSPSREHLRLCLQKLNVNSQLVYLTNIVKVPNPPMGLGHDDLDSWLGLFNEEMEIIEPRSVVLCGVQAASLVLNQHHGNLDQFRCVRFVRESQQETSYFVTFAPENVPIPPFGVSQQGLDMIRDLRAVFEADSSYFDHIRIIRSKT